MEIKSMRQGIHPQYHEINVTMTDGTEIYRTRFMGVEQKTARDACAYMVKHGQSCLVVSGP